MTRRTSSPPPSFLRASPPENSLTIADACKWLSYSATAFVCSPLSFAKCHAWQCARVWPGVHPAAAPVLILIALCRGDLDSCSVYYPSGLVHCQQPCKDSCGVVLQLNVTSLSTCWLRSQHYPLRLCPPGKTFSGPRSFSLSGLPGGALDRCYSAVESCSLWDLFPLGLGVPGRGCRD